MPPLGARIYLDPAYDISGFPRTQRAILAALQRYGALIGDNGFYSQKAMVNILIESNKSYCRSRRPS